MTGDDLGPNQGVPPGTTEYCVIVTEVRTKAVKVRRPSLPDDVFSNPEERNEARREAAIDTQVPWGEPQVKTTVSHWING